MEYRMSVGKVLLVDRRVGKERYVVMGGRYVCVTSPCICVCVCEVVSGMYKKVEEEFPGSDAM